MVYTLQPKPKVGYSDREERLFALLPKDGQQITSDKLMEKFWNEVEDVPYFSRITGMGVLRSLKDKVIENKEPFLVRSTKPSGRRPVKIWVEKRNGKMRH